MKSARLHAKGFTLIASLLMLLLLSGIAIGLLMMVNTEGRVGGTDLQNNLAFHAAEGGIETMYSNLSAVFQNAQSPTAAQICAVGLPTTSGPTMPGVTWTQYTVMPGNMLSTTCPTQTQFQAMPQWGLISAGPNQGLYAQIIPVNMLVTADLMGGQEVSMTRQAQVALIPVFQFGVFSESDLSFFSGPNFDVVGPVHTNGDLYPFVGPGSTLTFHNQVSAYGNLVRTQLANGYSASTQYNGTVDVPTAGNGCSTPTTNCTPMSTPVTSSPYGDGSVVGAGGDPPVSAYNTGPWNSYSRATNLELINGNYGSTTTPGTGAKKLSMPFVSGTNLPYQIIRRPPTSESPASSLGQSREYNMAQIHVLLSDDPTEFPNGTGWSDPNNVRLANITTTQASLQGGSATATNPYGITIASGNYVSATFGAATSGNTYNLYFAAGSNAVPLPSTCSGNACSGDWPYAPKQWTSNPSPTLEGLQPGTLAPTYLNNGAGPAITLCPPTGYTGSWPATCPTTPAYPYYSLPNPFTPVVSSALTPYNSANSNAWSLIDGYLRVEYLNNSGVWVPVTNEWLALGFARGLNAPTAPGPSTNAGSNPVNPNAILLLQEPADRNGNGTVSSTATPPSCNTSRFASCATYTGGTPPEVATDLTALAAGLSNDWAFGLTPTTTTSTTPQSITQYNWYPINFYDAREGEVRDSVVTDNSCTTNGVMNAVEIDVGNLKRWLAGSIGSSGTSVNYVTQNGYVLYYSDRRGMLLNANAPLPSAPNTKSGDSGLEDVINGSVALGTPNGSLEPTPVGKSISPEDVNQNGVLDNYGATNLGLGFYGTVGNSTQNLNTQINSTSVPDPFGTATGARIASCSNTARKNWVSGARHVLRLVDGSLGNVPLVTSGTLGDPGGFTVASENPVYIWGDYNSSPSDTTWNSPAVDMSGHSSAAVIADAVTLLSNSWYDNESYGIAPGDGTVTNPSNRTANTDYYRLAIAGGKNINFPQPTWSGVGQDFGTDGGVHNFLRYLENWNGTLNYKGSIVSLYYSTYGTGTFKCCTVVYNPPTRNYVFDSDFTTPQGLPPGTPMFRDVESLGYRQLLTTRKSGQ
jgi:hypothetical protein